MAALRSAVERYPDRCLLVAGDFNVPDVRWSETSSEWARPATVRSSRRAQCLIEGCNLAGLKQYVSCPTRDINTLDLVLCNMNCVADMSVTDGLFDSDHRQVSCRLENVKITTPLTSRQSAFNYKRADFDRLRESLRLVTWSVLDDLCLDDAVDKFYDILNAAIRDCIPVVHIKRNFPTWFDRDLRNLLREKEAAFGRVKRNRCEATESYFGTKEEHSKTRPMPNTVAI